VSGFARIAKGLQTLFPASGASPHAPSQVRDEVNLIHEFPGRVWQWERIERIAAVTTPSSLTGLLTILTAGVEEWVEILQASVSHDSVTSRNVEVGITFPGTIGATFVAKLFGMASAATPGQPSANEPLFGVPDSSGATLSDRVLPQRPLFLFPGSTLIIQSNPAAAAAFAFTVAVLFIRHPFPEVPLH